MNRRASILAAFFVGSTSAAHCDPLLPEKIAYQGASTQQVIPFRDGVLVESDHPAADSVMYAQFDQEETSPLEVKGIWDVMDVEQSLGSALFFGLSKEPYRWVLVEEDPARERRQVPVPPAFQAALALPQPDALWPTVRPRLIHTSYKAAAIVGDTVWWLDGEWKRAKLPKVPNFYPEFEPEHFGTVHLLSGTALYAGWDHGEWGGMLVSIGLDDAEAKWVHLSGKPVGDESGIPQNNPIHSIISPKKGDIWVATGLAHMGGTWRGLHHRDSEGKWSALIDGDLEDDRGPMKLPFPGSIQGIAADHSGQLYMLAGEAGVLRLKNEGMEHLIKHDFFSHSSDRGDHTVGSYPEALGIARNGDIFVSTNSFGVLAFRKKGDNWTARQITLNKEI